MSYTPTTWETGDIITAEKLNNMESGIAEAGNVFLIGLTTENTVFTKTFGEIKSALINGCLIAVAINGDGAEYQMIPRSIMKNLDSGGTVFIDDPETLGEMLTYVAATDNDYPTYVGE